jgi:hypothetical protein
MNDKEPEVGDFKAHLSSLVTSELVNKSEIAKSNTGSSFNIVFPDIPELNGVVLVVPFFPKDWKLWPHYTYDEIFRCINAQYPELTHPTFLGPPLHLQINVEGQDVEGFGSKEQTKELPNKATVELRYQPLRESDHGREEVRGAGAAADAGAPALAAPAADAAATLEKVAMALWDTLPPPSSHNEGWNGKKQRALAAAAELLGQGREAALDKLTSVLWDTLPPPSSRNEDWNGKKQRARRAAAELLDGAPVDPHPPLLHQLSRTMMTYDHKSGRYVEPIRDGTSGEWMTYDPTTGLYSRPTPRWSGQAPVPGQVMQGPPPMIYPNNGGSQTPGPYPYRGKKPQSKRGKKKSKTKSKTKKSKTKKSKSKSKRNNRRSYKR